MIDASIPLKGLLINRNDENLKQQQLQMNQMRMNQQQQEGERRSRLSDLIPKAAAGDQAAMGEVAAIDSDVWAKLNSSQSAALKANQEKILLGAKIVRQVNPKDEASWQMARQAAQRAGVDISDVPPNYDPNYVQQLVTVADALEKQSGGADPSSVREYEYAKQQGYDGSYVDFKGEFAAPLIFDVNGDGANDMVPRGRSRQPAQQSEDLPRISGDADYNQLKPGQRFITPDGQIRVKRGGQTASPSGPFPGSGY